MKNEGPIFDPATHYRITVQGRVDLAWLQSFDSTAQIMPENTGQIEELTVLHVHTDQSGIIGLLRRLHGLGMTIQQLQISRERRNE